MDVTPVERLVDLAGPALAPPISSSSFLYGSRLCLELTELLERRNGFYAFESALHVRPSDASGDDVYSIECWNDSRAWKAECGISNEVIFFAEDVFGVQFGLGPHGVVKLDPELLDEEIFAEGISEWCAMILADYNRQTGFALAHKWQTVHGRLPHGQRLVPKQPFTLGGAYTLDNLVAMESVQAIKFRCDLAKQIRDLPDGTKVRFIIR